MHVATNSTRKTWSNKDAPVAGTPKLRQVATHEWVSLARSSRQYNFQQSPAYSVEIAKRRGASCEFIWLTAAENQNHVLAVATVRVREIPFLVGGMAYISAGPLFLTDLTAATESAPFQRVLDALVEEYVRKRRLCLRIAVPTTEPDTSARIAQVFEASGFRIAGTGATYRTILVDLRRPIEEVRATLDRKWRNQLTAAQRGAVGVELSRDRHAVARFAPLLDETSQRKGFTTELDASFYDHVQQGADAEERMLVAIARENDQDVAGVVAALMGDIAVYVLGATTAASLKSKAAYALHWRVIEAARDAGCRWYDLGGVDPENNPGVYHFKSGFGGQEIVVPGPFEMRPPGFAGMVSRLAEHAYSTLKRWRS